MAYNTLNGLIILPKLMEEVISLLKVVVKNTTTKQEETGITHRKVAPINFPQPHLKKEVEEEIIEAPVDAQYEYLLQKVRAK